MKKKIICTILVLTMLIGLAAMFGTDASAAGNVIKVYTISTGNNTPAYGSRNTSNRIGTIYASDELYIYSIDNNWTYCSYPISSGRKYAYIPTSTITSGNVTSLKSYTARSAMTTYRRASTSQSYGEIYKNDQVLVLKVESNYVQVVYPVSGGYKMAWITKSAYSSYIINETTSTDTMTKKIDSLMNGSSCLHYKGSTSYAKVGSTWGNFQKEVWGIQCKGFATAVYYELHGYNVAAAYYGNARHKLVIDSSKTKVVFSEMRPSKSRMAELFANARPGDYIQMSKYTSQHSMIVYSVKADGVWVYDANWDGRNGIQKRFVSWDTFYNYIGSSSYGISVYRPK